MTPGRRPPPPIPEPERTEDTSLAFGVSEGTRKYVLKLWGHIVNELTQLEGRIRSVEDKQRVQDAAVDEVAARIRGDQP